MIDGIFLAVLTAGVTGLLVMPLALCEIIRLGRKNRALAERNAAQAAIIHRLEWPLSVGEAPEDGRTIWNAPGVRLGGRGRAFR